MKKSNLIGQLGEREAAAFLTREGHKILCSNYRIPGAEVDLLSVKGLLLYVIEVKATRSMNSVYEPLERVDARKVMRMKKAAGHYLTENPALRYSEMRMAVITVEGVGCSAPRIQFVDDSE